MKLRVIGYEITIKVKKMKNEKKKHRRKDRNLSFLELNPGEVTKMKNEKNYDVLDVARLMINHAIEKEEPISNLKLQKLLYYVQAAFLIEKEKPCFKEDIINWRYGPVVEDAYRAFRGYGSNPIEDIQSDVEIMEYDGERNTLEFVQKEFKADKIFNKGDESLIHKVVDHYKDVNAYEMIRRTHEEDPWLNTKQNDKICNDLIEKYFSNNTDKLWR